MSKGGGIMSIEKIRNLLFNAKDGIITSKKISEEGIHRGYLTQMVKTGELVKVGIGLYINADMWDDELYILQKKYAKGIFSYETALYLHELTDRTPIKFTMTFLHGYNTSQLKKENIKVKRVIKEYITLGVTKVKTPFGNIVNAYDVERTLCDIVRGNGVDDQIINEAMKRYVKKSDKDINKLLHYAEILRVKSKILKYLEVLL